MTASARTLLLFVAVLSPLTSIAQTSVVTPASKYWLAKLKEREAALDILTNRATHVLADGGVPTPTDVCTIKFETALLAAYSETHTTTASDETFYVQLPSDNGEKLNIGYSYDRNGRLTFTILYKVPKDWQVAVRAPGLTPGELFILTDKTTGCAFYLDSSDPFKATTKGR